MNQDFMNQEYVPETPDQKDLFKSLTQTMVELRKQLIPSTLLRAMAYPMFIIAAIISLGFIITWAVFNVTGGLKSTPGWVLSALWILWIIIAILCSYTKIYFLRKPFLQTGRKCTDFLNREAISIFIPKVLLVIALIAAFIKAEHPEFLWGILLMLWGSVLTAVHGGIYRLLEFSVFGSVAILAGLGVIFLSWNGMLVTFLLLGPGLALMGLFLFFRYKG